MIYFRWLNVCQCKSLEFEFETNINVVFIIYSIQTNHIVIFYVKILRSRVSMILSYIESRFSMTANHKSFQNQWQRIMRRLPHKMHLWQMLFNERYSRKLALFSSFGFYLTMLVFRSKKNTIFCVYWDLQNFFDQNICVTHWNFKKKNTWGQILEKPVLENFLELI